MPSPSHTGPSHTDLCVINYNGSRYLPSTLARVRELRDQFDRIVVVDDASTDDSVELVQALFPEAQLVVQDENRGPGAARNAGYAELTADRVLFMDNDVLLNSDVVARLSQALDDHPGAVMALPRVVSADDPDIIEYEGGDAHISGLVRLRNAGMHASAIPDAPSETIGTLISCCFLFDRGSWDDSSLFDEKLRIYQEDHELGLRARMRGKDILIVPSASCLHGKGTPGISIRETGRHTPMRVRNTILNRWQLIAKLYQRRTFLLLAPYLALFELYQFGGCVALGWGREWLGAVRDLLGDLGNLLTRRRAFQKTRTRADAAVLSSGPHPFNPALSRFRSARVLIAVLNLAAAMNWAVARRLSGGGRMA